MNYYTNLVKEQIFQEVDKPDERLKAKLEKLLQKVANINGKGKKNIQNQREIHSLKEQLQYVGHQNKRLQNQIIQAEEDQEQLMIEYKSCKQENIYLKKQNKDLQELLLNCEQEYNERLNTLQQERSQAIAYLETMIKQKQSQAHQFNARNLQLIKEINQLKLKNSRDGKQELITKLSGQLTYFKGLNSKISSELSQMASKAAALQSNLQSSKSQIKQKQLTIFKCQQKLKIAQNHNRSSQLQLKQSHQRIKQLLLDNKQLQNRNYNLQEINSSLNKEIVVLNQELLSLKEQNNNKQNMILQHINQSAQQTTKNNLEDVSQESSQLSKADYQFLKKCHQQYKAYIEVQHNKLQARIKHLQEQQKHLKQLLNKQRNSIMQLKTDLSTSRKESIQLFNAVSSFQISIKKNNQRIAQTKIEKDQLAKSLQSREVLILKQKELINFQSKQIAQSSHLAQKIQSLQTRIENQIQQKNRFVQALQLLLTRKKKDDQQFKQLTQNFLEINQAFNKLKIEHDKLKNQEKKDQNNQQPLSYISALIKKLQQVVDSKNKTIGLSQKGCQQLIDKLQKMTENFSSRQKKLQQKLKKQFSTEMSKLRKHLEEFGNLFISLQQIRTKKK